MKEAGLEEKWKELVREWQESGETLAAFARSRGIKDHQLWFWKDRILGTPKRGSRCSVEKVFFSSKKYDIQEL